MIGQNKIISTINSERKTSSNINPKAIKQSEFVSTSLDIGIKNRPTAIKSNDITDMAVWDYPESKWDGTDDNDKWDSFDENNEVFAVVTNYNDVFIENFDYDYFKGPNNTATWDTANAQVTFTSGQVMEIVSAFKDSTNVVTGATLTIVIDSGSFDLEMSADGGSNWESVTNATLHTFTNTGSDLRIRATENAASTGTITLTRCNYIK